MSDFVNVTDKVIERLKEDEEFREEFFETQLGGFLKEVIGASVSGKILEKELEKEGLSFNWSLWNRLAAKKILDDEERNNHV